MTTKKKTLTRRDTKGKTTSSRTASTNQKASDTYDSNGVAHYRQTLARLGMRPPNLASHRACIYLARHGKRFMVDFGLTNATGVAQHLRWELQRKAING